MTTADLITAECNAIKAMLLDKNARYGDSAMQPRRIFSRADHLEQLKVRIDDKLSRIATMGPDSEDEDTTGDLIGYLVLLRVARKLAMPVVKDSLTTEPWQSAIPEQDVQRREQVATGSPIMDKIAEACGLKKADVIADFKGVSFELDAEPVEPGRIYRVPDRTSRATLPDECLGALCGRGGEMKERLWRITDHICRDCGGRVLCCTQGNGTTPGGNRIHRCADCGASGYHASDICWCGFTHRAQHCNPYQCVPWSATKERPELIRALKACGFDEGRQEVGIVLVEAMGGKR